MDTQSLFSLKDRTALITGGSRGVGLMIAKGFLAQGAKVYISSRKAEVCDEVAIALGDKCFSLPMDVATVEGCRALADAYLAHESQLDILVNNAGALWNAPFNVFPEQGWDKVMDLNVKSPFFLTQSLLAALQAAASPSKPSKVINIGSIDGLRLGTWETYSYQASKAAIINLTKRLAATLINDQINVTAICPGAFPSEMNPAARDQGDSLIRAIPNKRIGHDDDMAAAAIYLAARSGDYVVGESITVDGGLVNASLPENILHGHGTE